MAVIYGQYQKVRELILNHIYTGKVESISRIIGLHSLLRIFNDRLRNTLFSVEDLLSQSVDYEEVEFNEISATFKVTSGRERTIIPEFWSESGEGPVLRDLMNRIQPDDVFWDIGANIGQYSCFIGEIVDDGKQVCFEPHPPSAARLEENLELNQIDGIVEPYVLSDSNGELYFDLRQNMPGGMGLITEDKSGKNTITVPEYTPETIIKEKEVPFPSVIKMDLGGEEWNVIQSMENILSDKRCRLLLIEVHADPIEDRGGSVEELYSMLESHGFSSQVNINRHELGSAHQILFEKE